MRGVLVCCSAVLGTGAGRRQRGGGVGCRTWRTILTGVASGAVRARRPAWGVPGRLSRSEEIVDPGRGARERAVGRRDEGLQIGDAVGGLGALVDRHPDALLIDDLAAAHERAAARPVAHLLRTRLRADVLHVAEHAVAARLAAEHRPLAIVLEALEQLAAGPGAVDPGEQRAHGAAAPAVSRGVLRPRHRQRLAGRVEHDRQERAAPASAAARSSR